MKTVQERISELQSRKSQLNESRNVIAMTDISQKLCNCVFSFFYLKKKSLDRTRTKESVNRLS